MKPLEGLQKDNKGTLIQFFSKLSSSDKPDQSKSEEFICSLYGLKGDVKDVNEAIYAKLLQNDWKTESGNWNPQDEVFYCC